MASNYYTPCPELDRCDELIEKYWESGHYYRGLGAEKDLSQAFYWTQRAAEHGDRDGQYNLGTLYENGEGVEKDLEKAKHWYRLAAEQKHREALAKCRRLKIM